MKSHDHIYTVNPDDPQPELIQKAADIISGGGVISFPTRCLYGLGADAFNAHAVKTVFQIKKRPLDKPMLVLVKDRAQMAQLVTHIPESAEKIIRKFWPGDITLIFKAGPEVPAILTAKTGKIGIRMPAHKVALALCNALENPITGTSANLSGEPGYAKLTDFHPDVMSKLDFILDSGVLAGGIGSTVIDMTSASPVILREGTVRSKTVLACLDSL